MTDRRDDHPPRLARWLIGRLSKYEERFSLEGDLGEAFKSLTEKEPTSRARLWYWFQALKSLLAYVRYLIGGHSDMLKNYFKIALRNLWNHKGYSFINIFGLAVGMAFCLFILIFIRYELSYDRHFENADRVFRITNDYEMMGIRRHYPLTPGAIGPVFKENIPEILDYARVLTGRGDDDFQQIIKYQSQAFEETGLFIVDPSFLKVFPYRFLKGDPETALTSAQSLVITRATAQRIFGQEDPMGKPLEILAFGMGGAEAYITGVVEDVPENSHFHFNFLFSTEMLEGRRRQRYMNEWTNRAVFTYVLVDEDTDIPSLESKMADVYESYAGEKARQVGLKMNLTLQKLTDIHLKSHLEDEIETNGNIVNVYAFGMIAFFTLLIACFNFMNLSTARSTNRAREVGIRKTFGARRNQLVSQFIGESTIISFIGLLFGSLIVILLMPLFNRLTGLRITVDFLKDGVLWMGVLGLLFVTGVLAGGYPAFFLSAFKPVFVIKELGRPGSRNVVLRKGLVVLQFSISLALLIGTLVVMDQLHFMKERDLGFDEQQVIVMPIERGLANHPMKEKILQHPSVIDAVFSVSIPGRRVYSFAIASEDKTEDQSFLMDFYITDYDLVKTYGMEILAGRDFSREFADESDGVCLLNEMAARRLGWGENAIGERITNVSMPNRPVYTVVGVIKDYHHRALQVGIQPLVILFQDFRGSYLSIRVREDNIPGTLAFLSDLWEEFEPDRSFDYFFLEEDFNRQYRAEERMGEMFRYFALVAMVISCLGLFGLASYTAEQKTKEIGIRKVLGATLANVVVQLSRHFILWVLIANVIACPVAYFVMKNWLQNFTYRTNLHVWMFLLPGIIVLMVALVTVSYQTIRAARANPVDSLRYE